MTMRLSAFERRHIGVFALLLSAHASAQQCAAGLMRQPFPVVQVGGRFRAKNCARDQQWNEVRIDTWGVSVISALRAGGLAGSPLYACDRQTTVTYAKSDHTDTVYFRPFVLPAYFKDKLPDAEYIRLSGSRSAEWPCHIVPVQKLLPWGPRRKKFIEVLEDALRVAVGVRTAVYNGCDGYFMGKPDSLLLADIEKLRENERIISAVINHISNVAYRNFLCNSFYQPYQQFAS